MNHQFIDCSATTIEKDFTFADKLKRLGRKSFRDLPQLIAQFGKQFYSEIKATLGEIGKMGWREFFFGSSNDATAVPIGAPIPVDFNIDVSTQAVRRWHQTKTITRAELEELRQIKEVSDEVAQNCTEAVGLITDINKNEVTTTQAYHKTAKAVSKGNYKKYKSNLKAVQNQQQLQQMYAAINRIGG
jgi:putative lipoic acid-binding regulatory protein